PCPTRRSSDLGELDRNQTITTEGLALQTNYSYQAELSGFQFTTGAYYSKKIGTNKRFDVGATYTLGANVNAKIEDLTTTYVLMDLVPSNLDTIRYQKIYGDMKLPQSLSIGASYRKDLNWMVGAQLDWGDWGGYKLDEDDNSNIDTRFRISAGGYWIPDFNSYKSYFNRVTYRLGGFYEATPLQFGDVGIKKYGMTLGFGFPVGKDRDASMLNLAVELGQLGKANYMIIRENYANVKIGFTLNDIWFSERVIDSFVLMATQPFFSFLFFRKRWLPIYLVVFVFAFTKTEDVDHSTRKKDFPSRSLVNANVIFKDSGFLKINLRSPLIEEYAMI